MSSFQLLSQKMQRKIWDMKWDKFTVIQERTIPLVIESNKDVIISSGTASGKTEAAFLPILSLIENTSEENLKVLYISPLKALINNQFERIERLCEYSNINVNKWHGDVNQSNKKKFLKNPSGILQITPESLESFFINRTEHLKRIFEGLEFIVIDEIHSFINTERGVQLRSLISRLEKYTKKRPRIIGLSATIDNFELVKNWVDYKNTENVEIIEVNGSDKTLLYHLMHFQTGEDHKKPIELFEDIRELTKNQKAIIFCNSRGEVEESTVLLNRLAQKEHLEETYYAHHSSIDKKEREYVEKTMMETRLPKSVIATSSLELGIDIGDVDIVIQLDSTFTVSSLKQRLGRSGRKRESNQILQLYTTNSDSLIQSLAVMELILEKWIEPAEGYPLPYDIMFHQVLSICQETNGINLENLISRIKNNDIFHLLEEPKIENIIHYMMQNDHLEKIKGSNELIVGIEGERILRRKEFYAVFQTTEEFDVLEGIRKIGTLDKTSILNIGDNIILSGKLWTVKDINFDTNKVYVQKAVNGNPPRYSGGGVKIHKRIGEKMMELLCSVKELSYIDDQAKVALEDIRTPYHHYGVTSNERIIWESKDEFVFETFTGTAITQTLVLALRYLSADIISVDAIGRIKIKNDISLEELIKVIKEIQWSQETLYYQMTPRELFTSKFSTFLPQEIQEEMNIAHQIDINGLKEYLQTYQIRIIKL